MQYIEGCKNNVMKRAGNYDLLRLIPSFAWLGSSPHEKHALSRVDVDTPAAIKNDIS